MGSTVNFTSQSSSITTDLSVIPLGGETITDPVGGPLAWLLGTDPVATLPGSTISIVTSTTANIIYRAGAWVTPEAPANTTPYTRYVKANAGFFFHRVFCYEGSSQLNAYAVFRVGVLEYTPGVGDINTDYTYRALWSTGSGWIQGIEELGTDAADQDPYGGATGGLGSMTVLTEIQRELKVKDRILVEWGIRQLGTKVGAVYFEHGGPGDDPENDGSGLSIAYGSECVIPINFCEQWVDVWSECGGLHIHDALDIAFTNINSTRAWLIEDWGLSGRAVTRRGSGDNITQQVWSFHSEDYLLISLNNIIDSCIQYSDHAYLFLCGSDNWRDALIPDFDDWMFTIDINGSESQTTDPSTPYTEGGNTEYGPRIWRGAEGYSAGLLPDNAVFPYGWEEGVFYAGSTAGTPRGFRFDAHDDVVASDTFTGVADTILPTYNANWIAYYHTTGTMQIGTGGVDATAPAAQTNEGGYRYNIIAGADNHAVEIDWTPTVLDTTWNGLFFKIDTGLAGTHYEVRFRANAGTGDIELIRVNSGTPTTLDTTTVTNITAGDIIRVRALFLNGAIQISFNGRRLIDYNDSQDQLINSGYCGIYITTNNNSFDNFSCGTPNNFCTCFWEEGVDFRMASEAGGCTTAPDPNTDDVSTVPKSARTTFKIKKNTISGWNGLYPLGFMLNNQCDVAANGNMMFPGSLGNQLDKPHWNYMGIYYAYDENSTASGSTSSGAAQDLRPIMGGHLHEKKRHEYFFSGIL